MIFTPYKDFELGLSEYKVLALSFNGKTVGVRSLGTHICNMYMYIYCLPPFTYIVEQVVVTLGETLATESNF